MEEQIFANWLAMVGANKRNPACAEIVAVADFWTPVVHGKSLHDVIKTARTKETDKQRKLREQLSTSITRYITEKIKTTYREVDRCDSIREVLEHPDPEAVALIKEREDNFFGSRSLDSFNDEFLLNYALSDPNAFQLINTKPYDRATEKASPYPSIIKSKYLRDWKYIWNDLQYLAYEDYSKGYKVEHLWTKDHAYQISPQKAGEPQTGEYFVTRLPDKPVLELYAWDANGKQRDVKVALPMDPNSEKESFYVTRFTHNLGFVPAERMGWVRSFEHDNDILESTLLPAKERYIDVYDKHQTYNTHLKVHGIAKQISYLPSCNYVNEDSQHCINGLVDGTECPKCKGTSMMPLHTSELDIITIELPIGDKDNIDIIEASKLHQYVEIPRHIIEMYKTAVDEGARDVALALFNTNVFKREELTAATATEVLQNNKSVDNALYAYGAHRGRIKEMQIKCIATYLDFGEELVCSYKYPTDYKTETEDELYMRLNAARSAGASPQILRHIEQQILAKQNTDDPGKVAYVQAVDRLRPFSDVTEAERIALFTALQPATHTKRMALLYFDDVIYKLDSDAATRGKWYVGSKKEQKAAFEKALVEIVAAYEVVVEPETDPFSEPIIEE